LVTVAAVSRPRVMTVFFMFVTFLSRVKSIGRGERLDDTTHSSGRRLLCHDGCMQSW